MPRYRQPKCQSSQRGQNESENEMSNSTSSSVLYCPRSLYTRLGNAAGGGAPVPVFLTLHVHDPHVPFVPPRPTNSRRAHWHSQNTPGQYSQATWSFSFSSSIAFPRSPTRSWWGTHHHRQCSCDAHRLPRSRSCIFCCRSPRKLFETCQRRSIP